MGRRLVVEFYHEDGVDEVAIQRKLQKLLHEAGIMEDDIFWDDDEYNNNDDEEEE